ncbi:MAG: efflux RND transporter permease subunit, partial [Planctomycetota bacterium]
REKTKAAGMSLDSVFNTLQVFLGSSYVNDFTAFGRNWRVYAQADAPFRESAEDLGNLRVTLPDGKVAPLRTLAKIEDIAGPAIVTRYNLYASADLNGITLPFVSSGDIIETVEQIAADPERGLPDGFGYEWTELTLQQKLAGNTAVFVFALAVVFVFLILAAQYESWSLPIAIILIVPVCLTAAIAGVFNAGGVYDIFTQIGLTVLVALSAKNAILVVEFAKQRQDEGLTRVEAAVDAAKLRLRPILMTAASFILGVLPLLTATGAGAEMRQALGLAVFSGMLGVTVFGLFLTPVFYVLVMWATGKGGR